MSNESSVTELRRREEDVAPEQLDAETALFKEQLDHFRAETQMSMASTAKLMDVNPGTMSKWFKVDPLSDKMRYPQEYVRVAVSLKIKKLTAADEAVGVFSRLRGLKPSERVELLQTYLYSTPHTS